MDEPTPILRADATDDDLGDLHDDCGCVVSQDIANSEAPAAEEPAIVEAEPAKRLVPVVVDGVFHGMREE